jgi:hypothetical protein
VKTNSACIQPALHKLDIGKNIKEPLINSGAFELPAQIARIKARIAGNSGTIAKIRNTEPGDLRRKAMFHELIRGS